MPRGYTLDASWTREQWSDACKCIERDQPITFAPQPWLAESATSQPLRSDPPHDMLAAFMEWLWGDDAP